MVSSRINSERVWFLDLDGTIFVHNKYLTLRNDEFDEILPGVLDFFRRLNAKDKIIIISSRSDVFRELTIRSLEHYNIRYDHVILNMPKGPRIIVNDTKVDGTDTAYAINLTRNSPFAIPDKYYKI